MSDQKRIDASFPRWMGLWLKAAGVYNVLWGSFVVFFPFVMFDAFGMDRPRYPEIWQCVGMIVGVYGLGYWWAAKNPILHWPIVAVGFLGKVFGPIGFIQSQILKTLPLAFGINNIFNDLIWLPSFFLILKAAKEFHQSQS